MAGSYTQEIEKQPRREMIVLGSKGKVKVRSKIWEETGVVRKRMTRMKQH